MTNLDAFRTTTLTADELMLFDTLWAIAVRLAEATASNDEEAVEQWRDRFEESYKAAESNTVLCRLLVKLMLLLQAS